MIEPWITTAVVSKKIVMEAYVPASPDASVAMFALVMNGRVQGFGYDAPLDCSILPVVERRILIRRPAYGAVVYDHIAASLGTESISLNLGCRTQTETHIPYYSMVRSDEYIVVADSNARTRSCLSENGYIRILYIERTCKVNVTGDSKSHDTRAGSLYSMTQSAFRAVISKRCDHIFLSSESAG